MSCVNNTQAPGKRAFDLAATGLLLGVLVHAGAWLGGAPWLAALGAPPSIVASAAAGTWPAVLGTLAITALLAILALYCFGAARGTKSSFQRGVLALFAVVFITRGSLVLPFVLVGQREWRTSLGHFVVTGQCFVAGSLVVLAIGILISIGLIRSRSPWRAPGQDRA